MPPALPKLSYVLLSHNREKYIRAAIESAFAQDYEGELEYIFSDDCSTDRTFDIIKECVAAYKGNRRVVVTQTPRNLHLAGNTNHAVQFVESDWVIRADDDDYSSIDRCSIIAQAIAKHPAASYIVTKVCYFVNDNEAEVRVQSQKRANAPCTFQLRSDQETVFDCATYSYKAWHIRTYRNFPPLHPQGYYVDDFVCYYRSRVLGLGVFVNSSPLVYARAQHDNMSSGGIARACSYSDIIALERFNNKYNNITLLPIIELRNCIASHSENQTSSNSVQLLRELDNEIKQRTLLSSYWKKGSINRLRIRKALGYTGLFSLIRCLPLPLFALCMSFYRKLRNR